MILLFGTFTVLRLCFFIRLHFLINIIQFCFIYYILYKFYSILYKLTYILYKFSYILYKSYAILYKLIYILYKSASILCKPISILYNPSYILYKEKPSDLADNAFFERKTVQGFCGIVKFYTLTPHLKQISMNRENESVLAMGFKVKNLGVKKKEELEAVPAVKMYFDELDVKLEDLIAADAGGRADLTGVTMRKSNVRENLELLGKKVSNGICSFAVVNEDFELLKRADNSASAWYKFSEEELITETTIILELAKPISGDLKLFGTTENDVQALEKELKRFAATLSDPSLAIDQRKADNKQVVRIIGEIRDLFNNKLDILMRSFEINNPQLYELYLSARAIDINGSISQPTAVVEVLPNAMQEVYKTPYKADTLFTLRNMGTEVVFFSLSQTNTSGGKEEVPLFPGETRSRLAHNLAPAGTFLMVRNPGESAAQIKIWAE